MYYMNFDDNITAKWRVVCEGWPLPKFCSPADLSTRNDVKLLLHSWKNGSTKFRRLSDEEFEKWEQEWFQSALDEMTMNEYDTGDHNEELNRNNRPADQPEPHESSSSSHIPRAYPPTEAQPNPANQPTPPPQCPQARRGHLKNPMALPHPRGPSLHPLGIPLLSTR